MSGLLRQKWSNLLAKHREGCPVQMLVGQNESIFALFLNLFLTQMFLKSKQHFTKLFGVVVAPLSIPYKYIPGS